MFQEISIHAPGKGATPTINPLLIGNCYFNPRSREGSDLILIAKYPPRSNFNPRSREGSDVPLLPDTDPILIISIHAPGKGATTGAGE